MSQVIVTDDLLKQKRESTRAQEAKISREEMFTRWRKSNIVGKKDPVKFVITLALLPVLALWALLTGFIYVVIAICEGIFKVLGKLVGGTKSLITGK